MDTTTAALVGVLALLTAGSFLWLGFMLWRPHQWAAFVDWEYGWLVRRGLIVEALAERCKRLEKGAALKWLVGGTALLGTLFLVGILVSMGLLLRRP